MFSATIDFIRSIWPNREIIPLHEPFFGGNEKKYLDECIDSTYVSSVGRFVDVFERKMEQFTGAKKAIVIVNGTEALHLALMLAGVSTDDEVITQPLTFVATANAITYCKAHPVFLDVDKDTLGMSPDSLEDFLKKFAVLRHNKCINRITKNRIKACVPMHTFGHSCRIDRIVEICRNWNIEVVEDAAESIGSLYKNQHTGTFGKIGVLSFNGNKTITTGGGGMVLTNDEELGTYAKYLSTQAKEKHGWEYYHKETGYNYRMPNINAALGVAQMEQIDFIIENKRKLAEKYRLFFSNIGIPFIEEPVNSRSNYWLNSILLKDRDERDKFLKLTNENGIMTRPVWRLMNELPMFEKCLAADLSVAKWIEVRLVNIPSSIH